MANVANVKVKQGNVLVLSGSSVEISGSGANSAVKVSGDMTVSGTLRADKMEITDVTYVTSSVLYRDGSTKFGNDSTDTHQFTGSVTVDGNVTATQFNGSGAGLTNIPNGALANSSVTVGSTSISLGGTSTTLAGLTSVTSTGFTGDLTGNADSATALATARAINGTNFDGTGDITTANWGTARDITIGGTTRAVNGSGNYSWSLSDIGAAGTGSANTFSGINVFQSTSNQFTGSFSGNGANLTDLDAGDISAGTLAAARGGTGVDGSAASNGQLLIGNGSGYSLATLTAGSSKVTVTNGAGSIEIDVDSAAIAGDFVTLSTDQTNITGDKTFDNITVSGSSGLTVSSTSALDLQGKLDVGVEVVTSTGSTTAGDSIVVLAEDNSTVTLPTANGNVGRTYIIKKSNGGTTGVTITPQTSEKIDGDTASLVLYGPYQSVTLVAGKSNEWFVL